MEFLWRKVPEVDGTVWREPCRDMGSTMYYATSAIIAVLTKGIRTLAERGGPLWRGVQDVAVAARISSVRRLVVGPE